VNDLGLHQSGHFAVFINLFAHNTRPLPNAKLHAHTGSVARVHHIVRPGIAVRECRDRSRNVVVD
jgi:hypothetical protein